MKIAREHRALLLRQASVRDAAALSDDDKDYLAFQELLLLNPGQRNSSLYTGEEMLL
jgi:hypothetical protein